MLVLQLLREKAALPSPHHGVVAEQQSSSFLGCIKLRLRSPEGSNSVTPRHMSTRKQDAHHANDRPGRHSRDEEVLSCACTFGIATHHALAGLGCGVPPRSFMCHPLESTSNRVGAQATSACAACSLHHGNACAPSLDPPRFLNGCTSLYALRERRGDAVPGMVYHVTAKARRATTTIILTPIIFSV